MYYLSIIVRKVLPTKKAIHAMKFNVHKMIFNLHVTTFGLQTKASTIDFLRRGLIIVDSRRARGDGW
jgi:hypothetical protein